MLHISCGGSGMPFLVWPSRFRSGDLSGWSTVSTSSYPPSLGCIVTKILVASYAASAFLPRPLCRWGAFAVYCSCCRCRALMCLSPTFGECACSFSSGCRSLMSGSSGSVAIILGAVMANVAVSCSCHGAGICTECLLLSSCCVLLLVVGAGVLEPCFFSCGVFLLFAMLLVGTCKKSFFGVWIVCCFLSFGGGPCFGCVFPDAPPASGVSAIVSVSVFALCVVFL